MYSKHRSVSPAFAGATVLLFLGALMVPAAAAAATEGSMLDFTDHWAGFAALAIFAIAYLVVIGEELLHLRKSKPVIVVIAYEPEYRAALTTHALYSGS